MTELAERPSQVTETLSAGVARIVEWAQSARAAHDVATSLVQTSFVPEAFRGKPGEATAAILAGAEVGLSPMASLRSFDIIQGTAAPRAITLRAIVQSFGHEVEIVESTATRCIARARRRGTSSWQQSRWTIERAKALNLTGKANWKNQPEAMLVARATAEVCRLVASDAILGIAYTTEELSDEGPVEATVTELKPARTARRAARKPVPVAEIPEPSLDEEETVTEPAAEPTPHTDHTSAERKMFALLNERGFADRDDALTFVRSVVDKPIISRSELTPDDVSRVINALDALTSDDPEPAVEEGQW